MITLRCLVLLIIAFSTAAALDPGQPEKDPHRLPCTSLECQKVRSFLKAHYCGESPFGDGPDDGCDIRIPKTRLTGINAIADFDCKWDERSGKAKCQQRGTPSPAALSVLLREMHQIGLPPQADRDLHFVEWEPSSKEWMLAAAYYQQVSGTNLSICQLIAVINRKGRVQILHKVPFQTTDADVPHVITWAPIDIADVDGDGKLEIILQGDAYEDHWFEVDKLEGGCFKLIFSGLGYYL